MSEQNNQSLQPCHLCGEPTDTFVRQHETRPSRPNYKFFERKIPLCESCFKQIQPTKANKQRVEFWRVIFPKIEEE
jgi:hypothetical protein